MLYRKGMAIFVAFLTLLSMTSVAFADTNTPDEHSALRENNFVLEKSSDLQKEVDKIIENDIKNNNTVKGPRYKYKTVYLSAVYTNVGGYPGNQTPGGYSFPTGGGFYYSPAGGPVVSGSISVSLPAPYNICSFSINLGTSSTFGTFVNVPSTTGRYKLYVVQTMRVVPYKVYRARVGTNNWQFYSGGSGASLYYSTPSAVRVG
mgnify:CR=1 FL=1|jgi:hypothetical protein